MLIRYKKLPTEHSVVIYINKEGKIKNILTDNKNVKVHIIREKLNNYSKDKWKSIFKSKANKDDSYKIDYINYQKEKMIRKQSHFSDNDI